MMAKTQKHPAAAFRFDCGAMLFAAKTDDGKIPVRLVARSAKPIEHWYWGRIVHDFAGMKHKSRIAVDYLHNDDKILGYVDGFDTAGDLVLSGFLTPFGEADLASEIAYKGNAGVPYEASIDFSGGPIKLQNISAGESAEVNGQTVQGPAVIVRKWTLSGVAICPHGVDPHTKTKFAHPPGVPDTISVEIEEPMSAAQQSAADPKTQTAPDQGEQSASAERQSDAGPAPCAPKPEAQQSKPAEPPAASPPAASADLPAAAAAQSAPPAAEPPAPNAEAKRFRDALGDRGAVLFAEGKTFEEAAKIVREELQLALGNAAAAQQALRGQAAPVSMTQADASPTAERAKQLTPSLGKNLAKVAAGMKIPGRK